MEFYYIYYHELGWDFDATVHNLNKVVYTASSDLNARQFFHNDFPNGTIWSIDTED